MAFRPSAAIDIEQEFIMPISALLRSRISTPAAGRSSSLPALFLFFAASLLAACGGGSGGGGTTDAERGFEVSPEAVVDRFLILLLASEAIEEEVRPFAEGLIADVVSGFPGADSTETMDCGTSGSVSLDRLTEIRDTPFPSAVDEFDIDRLMFADCALGDEQIDGLFERGVNDEPEGGGFQSRFLRIGGASPGRVSDGDGVGDVDIAARFEYFQSEAEGTRYRLELDAREGRQGHAPIMARLDVIGFGGEGLVGPAGARVQIDRRDPGGENCVAPGRFDIRELTDAAEFTGRNGRTALLSLVSPGVFEVDIDGVVSTVSLGAAGLAARRELLAETCLAFD
jgi:hypothetical protein